MVDLQDIVYRGAFIQGNESAKDRGDFVSERGILRIQARRLGIIRHFKEATKNISKTCRYFGISRAAFYQWRNRCQKYGDHGVRDRSRCALNSPMQNIDFNARS
jgi:hypothetical protein